MTGSRSDGSQVSFTIDSLGAATVSSPKLQHENTTNRTHFISDNERILLDQRLNSVAEDIRNDRKPLNLEPAGPREKIYFDPSKLRCAIVTCGGLCPGLNGIIQTIVDELYHGYNVKKIYGIRYGLRSFVPECGHDIMELNPARVSNITARGGSILGTSRGARDMETIIDSLERMNISVLFIIGGDGTLVAAMKLTSAIRARGIKIGVIGIPKTIDNDIYLLDRSFGFDTAVELASQAVWSAYNEAVGHFNGIGIVKLMGRYSGFIAATVALAVPIADFVLIPEIKFNLHGPGGLLSKLKRKLATRNHAVIIVAEGAGQDLFSTRTTDHDRSGNIRFQDIGQYLKKVTRKYFQDNEIDVTIKYIDPSYIIRSLPANANDRVFCNFLGLNAVHAAMAGKTNLFIGHLNNQFVHVPLDRSAGKRKKVALEGRLWQSVLSATGQGELTDTN
ncbi:ATP-dependent 6-phosphofructokinase [Desulfomarina sp.]